VALTSRRTQGTGGALFLGALGMAYLLLAKFGLALASLHPNASPIWPPSGLALASCLLWGNRVWPAIASGAFLAGAMTFGSIATSMAIAIGNTLEGVVTASLVARWCTRDEPFGTPTHVVVYSGVAFAPGTVISATVGVGSLVLAGYADPSKFGDIWFTWWLGDVGGLLVVAPIIILWANANVFSFDRDEVLRMAWLMVATIAVGLVAFSPLIEQTPRRGVFAFLAIGPLLWAALRYSQRDTATVVLVLSSFAIWGTVANKGPFAGANLNDSFLLLLMFVISTAVPSMVLSADVSVRRQAQWRKALLVRKLQHRIKNVLAARKDLAETLEALGVSEARSRAQAEQLRAVSDELSTTLNTAGIGIARCSRDLRYLRANDTYATIVGLPLGEIIGRPMAEVMGEAAFTTIRPYLERVLAGERVEYECVVALNKRVEKSFFRVVCVPDRDLDGSVIGWIACVADITSSKRAEARLAERNAQLDLAGKIAKIGSFTYDNATQKIQLTPGCVAIYGLPEGTLEISRDHWRTLVHPADLPRMDAIARRAFTNRESELVLEFRILRHGEVRWIESRSLISYNEAGKPIRRIGAQIDVTERKLAEQAQTDRNAQLALAGRAVLVGRYAYDVRKGTVQVSEGYVAIHGLPAATTETPYSEWRTRVHPEDLARAEGLRDQAFADRRKEDNAEYRIVLSNGEVRWIERRGSISYGADGRPERVVGVNIDVTDRKRAEERQRVLIAELDHRVKNALATVSSVVSQTGVGSRSVANFVAALDGRLRSMATTHELLSSGRWQGISLTELIRHELAPYATRHNTKISGPEVVLRPEAGQAMAMVLHELATNAAKHGALSTKKGRVSIRWDRPLNGHPPRLVLEWQEIDGPAVEAPGKPSYGTSTIRDLIPYELGGAVDFVLAPDGVKCRLELPADWLSNHVERVPGTGGPAGLQ